MKRKRSRLEVRLDKELIDCRNKIALLETQLRKEKTKSDCYHDASHRFDVYRNHIGSHYSVTICGLCGKEISGERMLPTLAWYKFGPDGGDEIAELRREMVKAGIALQNKGKTVT